MTNPVSTMRAVEPSLSNFTAKRVGAGRPRIGCTPALAFEHSFVDLMAPYSKHLDDLKTVHTTVALTNTAGVIADEPDLGAGVGVRS